MIYFPNAKINLGLHIERRRPDNYHDIRSMMYPVGWCDILEIVPSALSPSAPVRLFTSGRAVACPPEKNLVMKAVRALEIETERAITGLDIYLEKIIPDGAGLGGGSSDAAYTVRGITPAWTLG